VPSPMTTFTPAPLATLTTAPTTAPTTGPTAPPTAAPVAAAAPTAAPAAPAAVAGTQRLPSTSTGDPLGPLAMLGFGLTGVGILLLVRRPARHQ
jgi:hypothetical protein